MQGNVEKMIHTGLWLLFLALLYSSAGKISRVVTLANGESNITVDYDITVLFILCIDLFFKVLLFYGNLFLLNWRRKRLKTNQKTMLVIWISTFLSTLLLSNFIIFFIAKGGYFSFDTRDMAIDYLLPYSLIFHFFIFFLSLGYSSIQQKREDDRLKEALRKENLNTELKFLKAQIHPHFFFNTLNNIYAIVRKYEQPEAARSVAQLARIMRYMIYESNTERVSLKRELDHLKDFINLQLLRLKDPQIVHLEIDLQEEQYEYEIAPMIFIPFVENAFKFGISNSRPSKIDIKLFFNQQDQLEFQVINSNHHSNKHNQLAAGGLGLPNVQRRLELLYTDQYELVIQDRQEYSVNLKIALNGKRINKKQHELSGSR